MWSNEMRLGLWNAVRRMWTPRGAAVAREVQINRRYAYVVVALDPRTWALWWAWQANMKSEEMARIRGVWAEDPAIDGWVGRGRRPQGCGQAGPRGAPGGAAVLRPELNPVERFLRELRRALGDRVYPTLEAKKEALEPILRAWQADPTRVRQLCGWAWIREVLTTLPADTQVA